MSEPNERLEQELPQAETSAPASGETRIEEVTINGDALFAKVKDLVREGNTRRIVIKNQSGNTLLEIPLVVGVVGGVVSAVAFPAIAALSVVGTIVARLTLVIEKKVS
jgi:hypothetical protein